MNQTTQSLILTQYSQHNQQPRKIKTKPQIPQSKQDRKLITKQDKNNDGEQDATFQKLLLFDSNLKQKAKINFQINSDQNIINHDIQLQQYLSGVKIFKQKNCLIEDFSKNNEVLRQQGMKVTRHKKQKSKSLVSQSRTRDVKFKLLSNRNCSRKNSKLPYCKENVKTQDQTSDLLKKTFKQRKTIKFLNPNESKLKEFELKSLEIQLVMKRVNQRRKSSIKQIMKKLNLPKLNPTIQSSLQRLIQSRSKSRPNFILSEHSFPKTIQMKNKTVIQTNLTPSISKLQENKIKELNQLEKQIFLNKIKSNQLKNQKIQQQSKQYLKTPSNLQRVRSLFLHQNLPIR